MDQRPESIEMDENAGTATRNFLEACIKYEHFKRSDDVTIYNNLTKLMNSERTKEAASQLEELGIDLDLYRMKENKPKAPKIVEPEAYEDSDSSTISECEKEGESLNKERSEFKKVINVRTHAKLRSKKWKTFIKDIFDVMRTLKHPLELYKAMDFEIERLSVTVGFRRIRMEISNRELDNEIRLQYMSNSRGCLYWYGDNVRLVEDIKYQSLAAKHFLFLVRHQKENMENFEMHVEKHSPEAPAFHAFYDKIGKYLLKFDCLIRATNYSIMAIENPVHFTSLSTARLDSEILKKIKIRVADDGEVYKKDDVQRLGLTRLYPKASWKSCSEVDILDERIQVKPEDYCNFFHFDVVRMFMPDVESFLNLVKAFASFNVVVSKKRRCNFHFQPSFCSQDIVKAVEENTDGCFDGTLLGEQEILVITLNMPGKLMSLHENQLVFSMEPYPTIHEVIYSEDVVSEKVGAPEKEPAVPKVIDSESDDFESDDCESDYSDLPVPIGLEPESPPSPVDDGVARYTRFFKKYTGKKQPVHPRVYSDTLPAQFPFQSTVEDLQQNNLFKKCTIIRETSRTTFVGEMANGTQMKLIREHAPVLHVIKFDFTTRK